MARIDITDFERLMCDGRLNRKDRSHIIKYLSYIISINKGMECEFLSSEGFLKEAKIVLKKQDPEICALLTSYTKFGRLISNSKLSERYKLYAINYVTCIINTNKGKNSDFVNNEDFLKTVKVISNCKQQDSEIYTLLTSHVESYIKSYIQLINNIRLINNSRLYKSYEIILHSPMQLRLKCLSIMSMVSCVNNNQYEKLNFIPYALLGSVNKILL
ncbi:hypothetical protein [Wolbachia endosymbiont (group E) of Neria commutata]|uniref:hypothetical protein n=1 Tax=Wolbachia endosymbiont (group E) of Neria commutata TaxID=3066149 RepID=UPI003132B787